ncbi:MAG: MBL fold metallo-hydrolase [Acidimicrobiales bacterium]
MSDTSTTQELREERRPAREEAEEVAPGVLRIQLPISMPGLGHVNCYAMEDSQGVTLVDPGLPGPTTWRQLKRRLSAAGLPIERVHTVVITHSHPDHFGQAARFRSRYGAEIITHHSFRTFMDPAAEIDDDDIETVFEPGPDGSLDHLPAEFDPDQAVAAIGPLEEGPMARTTPWGGAPFQLPLARRMRYWAMRYAAGRFVSTPSPSRGVDEADVITIGGREWVAVHTPGHTRDHLCLWDPAHGVMISGDHVLPTITPHISGLGATVDPLADFFSSLDRMAGFKGIDVVLPAHGLEFADLAGRAEAIKEHHEERLTTLREAGDSLGQGTVEDYMRVLFKPRSWGSMAESETYAHLEHLRLLHQASVSSDGSQLRYEMAD